MHILKWNHGNGNMGMWLEWNWNETKLLHLQQLRLAGARVSTEKNVYLGSELPSTSVLEILPCTTKQLEQNPFLDVIVFIDARS